MRLPHRLILIPILFLTALLPAACGGETTVPTPQPTIPPTIIPDTATLVPTATSMPTATPMPTATTVPTPVPATVSGRVLWGGQPVANAIVQLRAPDWRVTGDATAVNEVTAGAAGQFLLTAVPPGEYSVVAVWPDGTPSQGGTPAVVLEPGQTVSDLTLKLEAALALVEPELGGLVATLPTVRWELVDGASAYRVGIIHKGTTELVVDAVVAGDALDVLEPLATSTDYTLVVSAFGDAEDALASFTADFVTADAPSPPRALVLPTVCAQPGLPTFLDRAARICFAYPQDHVMSDSVELPTIAGPPVNAGAIYFPSVTVATMPGTGRDLAAVVEEYLPDSGADVATVDRVATTVAGSPAEILEPVPGEFSTRQVAIARDDAIVLLSFSPTFRDVPAGDQDFLQRKAQIAADNLFETVMATVAFLPSPGEAGAGGIELPAACVIEGMGLYVAPENPVATDDEAGAGIAALCFAIPPGFTAQPTPQGQPRLIGPALDASLSPMRATFALEPPQPAEGRTLDEIVGDYLSTAGDDDTVPTELTVGGETAILLDNLPAGRGSQEVFFLHDGQLYHLLFQPDPDRVPAAEADMARLMEAVLGSLAFLEQ